MDFSSTTARILVPRGLDRGLTNRIPSVPRRGRQCVITEMLRKSGGCRFDKHSMDILGDATKLPFILDLVEGTLSGGGYETIQLHRFHAATECFAETVDTISIPPHSEVILWAKLKTNNGRRGLTAGVVLALQTFVQ